MIIPILQMSKLSPKRNENLQEGSNKVHLPKLEMLKQTLVFIGKITTLSCSDRLRTELQRSQQSDASG